ncbi:MAG: TetR/AcrR family transcriptional regulator [Myxococcota bacterium]
MPYEPSAGQRARTKILDAAVGAFAARGFYGVTIREVGQAAGMSNASLLHHYPNKEQLYRAVLAGIAEQLESVDTAVAAADPSLQAKGAALFDAWIDWSEAHRDEAAVLARELLDNVGRVRRVKHLYLAGVFRRLVRQFAGNELSDADAALVVLHILGSISYFFIGLPTTTRIVAGGRKRLTRRYRAIVRAQVLIGLEGIDR